MTDDQREGLGRRNDDYDRITASELDHILQRRDERVRQIVHQEVSDALRPIHEHIADHGKRLTKTERALWGEDQIYEGIITQLATVSTQLSEMTQLLTTARALLTIMRIAVPAGGLAIGVDIALRLLGG